MGGFSAAQPPPGPQERIEPPFPYRLPKEHLKSGEHAGLLRAILDMRAREAEAMADPAVKMAYVDILPWYLVVAGEHRAAAAMETLAREAFRYPRGQRTKEAPYGEVTAVPAAAKILEAARGKRVVMLNEEHRSSVQRAFLNEVVEGLAAEGFTHLAMEAVSSGNAAGINERGFVVLSRDVYTLDPAMADAMRRARAAGMTIVSYDYTHPAFADEVVDMNDPVARENARERSAARHLRDVLEGDPEARMVVFAGRGHISKAPAGEWVPMATLLQRETGIEPLSIDLTHMVEFEERAFEANAYHHATEQGLVKDEPVVLVRADGSMWSHAPKTYDAVVFHPRAKYEDERPRFLRMGGLRKAVRVAIDRERAPGPALVQAHLEHEPEEAVAVDQVIIWPRDQKGEDAGVVLLLRPGKYRVRAIDREGRELQRERIEVR